MNKTLTIFAVQCCLTFVGCYSVSKVTELSASNVIKQNQNILVIAATPNPTVKAAQTVFYNSHCENVKKNK